MNLAIDERIKLYGVRVALVLVWVFTLAKNSSVGSHERIVPKYINELIVSDISPVFFRNTCLVVYPLSVIIDSDNVSDVFQFNTEASIVGIGSYRVGTLIASASLLRPHLNYTEVVLVRGGIEVKVSERLLVVDVSGRIVISILNIHIEDTVKVVDSKSIFLAREPIIYIFP